MTVEELIELLKQYDPKREVLLHFTRYTKHRHISRATRPVSYPIDYTTAYAGERWVYLMAEQKGDFG